MVVQNKSYRALGIVVLVVATLDSLLRNALIVSCPLDSWVRSMYSVLALNPKLFIQQPLAALAQGVQNLSDASQYAYGLQYSGNYPYSWLVSHTLSPLHLFINKATLLLNFITFLAVATESGPLSSIGFLERRSPSTKS